MIISRGLRIPIDPELSRFMRHMCWQCIPGYSSYKAQLNVSIRVSITGSVTGGIKTDDESRPRITFFPIDDHDHLIIQPAGVSDWPFTFYRCITEPSVV
jgi:hypothetical protein